MGDALTMNCFGRPEPPPVIRTGKCLCGKVTITTKGDPMAQLHCHCESCRKWAGQPQCSYMCFQNDQVELKGTTKLYKSSEDTISYRYHCVDCGCPVWNDHPGTPWGIAVAAGIMDCKFEPAMHIRCEEASVDIKNVKDGLPKFLDLPEGFGGTDAQL